MQTRNYTAKTNRTYLSLMLRITVYHWSASFNDSPSLANKHLNNMFIV